MLAVQRGLLWLLAAGLLSSVEASGHARERGKAKDGQQGSQPLGVLVSMVHSAKASLNRHQSPSGLRELQFCLSCPDPHLEGTQILALGAVHGPDEYKVKGELAYAVPNHVGGNRVLNPEQIRGKVAFVNRGLVPLVDKILAAQKVGAVGVIIADDGSCDEPNECGLAGNVKDGGFSKLDQKEKWKDVKIPSVLISTEEGERIRKMMRLRTIKVPNFGDQLICI